MVLEAFSAGKTVIATNIPGTIEIIAHNYYGLLCPKRDEKCLTYSMQKLIENMPLRNELSKNALNTYENEFSFWEYKSKVTAFFELK